jgi:glucose 1-dehydrogenase
MSKRRILENQVALITGASSGIGKGIAIAMGAAGAKVVVNFISSEEDAERVVNELKESGGEAIAVMADVSKEDQVIEMFKKILGAFGSLDIMVNNSGVQKDSGFEYMTLKQWQAVIDVNLTGAFLCSREAVREFLRRGVVPERSKAAGKIIFISSVHEVIPWTGHANYAASKGGIMLLMKSLAQELAPGKFV